MNFKVLNDYFMICLLAVCWAACTDDVSCHSPNGKIGLEYAESPSGQPSFTVTCLDTVGREHRVIDISQVGVDCNALKGNSLRLKSVAGPQRISESYTMLTGKKRNCSNEASEYLYTFTDSLGRELGVRFRLYNDGVVFRYELAGLEHDSIQNERTTYRIPEGTRRWMQKYDISYEDFYPMSTTGQQENRHWAYPALVQADEEVWTLITEAGIERYHSASSLANGEVPTDYQVVPAENHRPVSGDWHSPWRVLIVGSLADIVESTLVTDVSEPCRLTDTDWIRPGSVSWIYWAYNHGSKDYQIVKKYIDMAAELHLPYVLIDWEWDVMENGGTIDDALRYADSKGVRVLLWYNSSTAWASPEAGPLFRLNKPEDRDREYAMLNKKGVAGVKIDFFAGDTQETMNYCIDLLEDAAKYHLLVNFHGTTIPRGWQRTYPNFMSAEGVYGAEWYNNKPVLTDKAAAHNATSPFTRNVVGPMDYTPCTFSDSQHPHITTHAHELALSVVFESALQHWADRPESYLSQLEAVRQFMGELPTAWDDTRLLSGYPGESVVMARRKGDVWYVGGLNGTDHSNALVMDWSFLPEGTYRVTTFADGVSAGQPWNISVDEVENGHLPTACQCNARGGFVVRVKPVSAITD